MVNDIFLIINTALTSVYNTFTYFISSTGMGGILLAFIFIFFITRLLIMPLIGSGLGKGFDYVDKFKKNTSVDANYERVK